LRRAAPAAQSSAANLRNGVKLIATRP
jgi:hypothetical protein